MLRKLATSGLSVKELDELIELCHCHQPALLSFLDIINRQTTTGICRCPPHYKKLMEDLAAPTPVCSMIPYISDIFVVTKKVVRGEDLNASDTSLLLKETPFLLPILKHDGKCTRSLMAILIDMMRISEAPFKKTTPHKLPPANRGTFGSYFPSLPLKCERGIYEKDSYKKKLKKNAIEDPNFMCKKSTTKKHHLIPGLLHFSCVHGTYFFINIIYIAKCLLNF